MNYDKKLWHKWVKSIMIPPRGKIIHIDKLPDDGTKSGIKTALKFNKGLRKVIRRDNGKRKR